MRVFDAHCDTLTTAYRCGQGLRRNTCQVDLERGMQFDAYAQIFAVWVEDRYDAHYGAQEMWGFTNAIAQYFERELAQNADKLERCTTAKQLLQQNGKVKAILSLEGGNGLGGDAAHVQALYDRGFRIITLAWNGENDLACGAVTGNDIGIKPLGRQVLSEMKRLHMLADVSHLNERGFYEAAESGCPLIATHSNSRALCDHVRNLTDAQFLLLRKQGSGTGINLYPPFVGSKGSIQEVAAHLEHFLSLGGEDSVFLGADWDGIDCVAGGLTGIQSLPILWDELVKLNYPEPLLDKIFYTNLQKILAKTLFNHGAAII